MKACSLPLLPDLRCGPGAGLRLSLPQSVLLEALRLPDPGRTGWPEAERLRAPAAVMLREHDRSGLHEAGCVLAARLTMTAAS